MPSFLPAILFQWLGALYPSVCQPWRSSEMAASGLATSCVVASSLEAPSLVSSGLASSSLASSNSVSFGISCTGWLFWVLWSLVPWFCHSLCGGVRFGGWWVWRQWVWSVAFGGGGFGSWWVQAASGTPSQCCWTHQCHQDCRMQCKPNPMCAGRYGVFVCRCSYLRILRMN